MTPASGHDDHGEVLSGILDPWATLFRSSEQGMYVFLDNDHFACSGTLARWLGYASPDGWRAAGKGNFVALVQEASRHALVRAFQAAMERAVGSQVPVAWLGKEGRAVATRTLLVPVDVGGHRVALHFIDRV